MRLETHFVQNMSIIWNDFLQILVWICKELCWKVGSGGKARIGIDPLAGMENYSFLSQDLLEYLHNFGIVTLNQIYQPYLYYGSNAL